LYILRNRYSDECYGPGKGRIIASSRRIILDVVEIHLSRDNLSVELALLLCEGCLGRRRRVRLPVSYQKLIDVRTYSAHWKYATSVPEVALLTHLSYHTFDAVFVQQCAHLYKIRPSTKPEKIGCFYRHLLIENAAAKLNYSVDYIPASAYHPAEQVIAKEVFLTKQYSAVSIVGFGGWLKWEEYISPENMLKHVLRGESRSLFLYCTETKEREGFSFLFWTVPLDTWSWLMLGSSVIAIIGVLRGQWFPVFAILMRQDCRILQGKQKLLMIFILATIIFTYGYEGVVSSLLTVQPPVFVFKTLKELLFNDSYKIATSVGNSLAPFQRIFEQENIPENMHSKIAWKPRGQTRGEEIDALAQCNTTITITAQEQESWKVSSYYD